MPNACRVSANRVLDLAALGFFLAAVESGAAPLPVLPDRPVVTAASEAVAAEPTPAA